MLVIMKFKRGKLVISDILEGKLDICRILYVYLTCSLKK